MEINLGVRLIPTCMTPAVRIEFNNKWRFLITQSRKDNDYTDRGLTEDEHAKKFSRQYFYNPVHGKTTQELVGWIGAHELGGCAIRSGDSGGINKHKGAARLLPSMRSKLDEHCLLRGRVKTNLAYYINVRYGKLTRGDRIIV